MRTCADCSDGKRLVGALKLSTPGPLKMVGTWKLGIQIAEHALRICCLSHCTRATGAIRRTGFDQCVDVSRISVQRRRGRVRAMCSFTEKDYPTKNILLLCPDDNFLTHTARLTPLLPTSVPPAYGADRRGGSATVSSEDNFAQRPRHSSYSLHKNWFR